ncbi:MAG: methylated-DNA--[protein]-cysteine S-methyltransferase [Caulobacter sp.]|nr:methylated-DNA--[protein]-cysteine S-methyltransferase [Caulobacter sp.]
MRSTRPERLTRSWLATPIGELQIVTDEDGVVRVLDFDNDSPRTRRLMSIHYADIPVVERETPKAIGAAFDRYFAGEMAALADIPWRVAGTDFQRQVWHALTEIPAGETRTYSQQAARIGRPAAVRAVGLANGANPIGIVIPCHRVIGSGGSLTGYGGGIERKRWLLTHEGATLL